MPNAKLVRASDVKDLLMGLDELPWEENVDNLVDSLPTVDAVEVVHGRWIDTIPNHDNGYYNNAYKCSNCGDYYTTDPNDLYYCPRCGAKMEKFNRPNRSPTFEQRMEWVKGGVFNG